MHPHLEHWLAIIRAPGWGGRLPELLQVFGDASALATADRKVLHEAGLSEATLTALHRPDRTLLNADRGWLEGGRRGLLTIDQPEYPPLLRSIPGPPAWLFYEGEPALLLQAQIAIVGSRSPTTGGLRHARAFAQELGRSGMVITSGLASGIDAAAHRAALDVAAGTVAVTGTGLDLVYPRSSKTLAQSIRDQGVLVSEFPPGTGARASHFPARNRIISGLSLAVLVVEAGLNSGSLITARLAAEQGREVFVLPGSLHNPMVRGCHRLIREGARLTETTADILAELGPLAARLAADLSLQLVAPLTAGRGAASASPMRLEPRHARLLDALGHDPLPVEVLGEQLGMPAQALAATLLLLELEGLVERLPGGRVSRLQRAP